MLRKLKSLLETISDEELAIDPNTPTDQLKNILRRNRVNPDITRAIAQNPNTDFPSLISLQPKHAQEVDTNPALDLHLFTDPDLYHEHDLPELNKVSNHKIIDFFSRHSAPEVRRSVASNKHTSPQTLDTLAYPDQDEHVLDGLVQNHTNVMASTLDKIASHPNSYFRAKVAEHPNVSLQTLLKLKDDPDMSVLVRVIKNHKIPEEIMNEMYEKSLQRPGAEKDVLHWNLAHNENISSYLLHKLTNTYSDDVLSAIGEHKNATIETLQKVVKKGDDDVRRTVADNKSVHMTPELLDDLSNHHVQRVLYAVACNPKTSDQTLQKIVNKHPRTSAYFKAEHRLSGESAYDEE